MSPRKSGVKDIPPTDTGIDQKIPLRLKKEERFFSYGLIMMRRIFFWGIFFCALGTALYYYNQYRKVLVLNQQSEADILIEKLSATVDLPQDETPTLATVTDKEKLASQEFFRQSENGDKVLIYTDSGKVILYRPSSGKVIAASFVRIERQSSDAAVENPAQDSQDDNQKITSLSDAEEKGNNPRVALYNGSKTVGITYKMEEKLKESFPKAEVVAKDNAARRDYAKTLVIDVSGKYASFAEGVARDLSVEIRDSLPAGEATPEADVLIVIGEDKSGI